MVLLSCHARALCFRGLEFADGIFRFELFLLGEGEKKITETPFPRKLPQIHRHVWENFRNTDKSARPGMSNCSDFLIKKEDHTIGNLVSEHLKQHPHVLMSGYKGMPFSAFPLPSSLHIYPRSC